MTQKSKIKITDDIQIRNQIFELYQTKNQKELANWALKVAVHILEKINLDTETIQDKIEILNAWQEDKKTTQEIRQAALSIHQEARNIQDEIQTAALRTLGHAIATGHMKEHALVASDYAIQCINKITQNDPQASSKERTWQIKQLKK